MRSGTYCPGPGDLGLDELEERERRADEYQAELDEIAAARRLLCGCCGKLEWTIQSGDREIGNVCDECAEAIAADMVDDEPEAARELAAKINARHGHA